MCGCLDKPFQATSMSQNLSHCECIHWNKSIHLNIWKCCSSHQLTVFHQLFIHLFFCPCWNYRNTPLIVGCNNSSVSNSVRTLNEMKTVKSTKRDDLNTLKSLRGTNILTSSEMNTVWWTKGDNCCDVNSKESTEGEAVWEQAPAHIWFCFRTYWLHNRTDGNFSTYPFSIISPYKLQKTQAATTLL